MVTARAGAQMAMVHMHAQHAGSHAPKDSIHRLVDIIVAQEQRAGLLPPEMEMEASAAPPPRPAAPAHPQPPPPSPASPDHPGSLAEDQPFDAFQDLVGEPPEPPAARLMERRRPSSPAHVKGDPGEWNLGALVRVWSQRENSVSG